MKIYNPDGQQQQYFLKLQVSRGTGTAELVAVNSEGHRVLQGSLLTISSTGIKLMSAFSPEVAKAWGIKLEGDGEIPVIGK